LSGFGKTLMEQFSFKKKNLNILSDKHRRLSRLEILKNLKSLVDHAKQGDQL
jgi:hypothetical protein